MICFGSQIIFTIIKWEGPSAGSTITKDKNGYSSQQNIKKKSTWLLNSLQKGVNKQSGGVYMG